MYEPLTAEEYTKVRQRRGQRARLRFDELWSQIQASPFRAVKLSLTDHPKSIRQLLHIQAKVAQKKIRIVNLDANTIAVIAVTK